MAVLKKIMITLVNRKLGISLDIIIWKHTVCKQSAKKAGYIVGMVPFVFFF
jgi:hypothetical protein